VTGLESCHGSSLMEFPPSPVRVLGESAGFAGDGSIQGDAFSVPSVEVLPTSPLSKEWEDYFSSVPALESFLGVFASKLTKLMCLSVLKEAFFVPWEVDAPASPLCRDREVTFSGVEETQVVRPSSSAKGLLRRGSLVQELPLPLRWC
jgi:hypothetical protein